jgi:hypothetical protein
LVLLFVEEPLGLVKVTVHDHPEKELNENWENDALKFISE